MVAKKKAVPGPVKSVDLARQHYMGQKRSIVVEEWGGMELFFTPMTGYQLDEVNKRVKAKGKNASNMDRSILALIFKAQDKDGRPHFEPGDFRMLKTEVALPVLQRVIGFMWADVPTPEEAKKRVKADPTSASG